MTTGDGCTLQLSSPASPALGSSLVIHPTASTVTAQLTKWVKTLLWQPGFIPAQYVFTPNLLCLPKIPSSVTCWVQAAQEEGWGVSWRDFSQGREDGREMLCLLSCLCSEVKIITCFFSFYCCAQTIHSVFACLHHGIRFYNPLLASIRVIVLDGRSEQMSASAIHWPPDIYFNFIVGAYHALVT